MLERVISMHAVDGLISEILQIEKKAALIGKLGELHTEDNITSYLKAPCSIHGQSNFINFNSSTGEIPFPHS